jgi:hypothetical protein
MRPIGEMSMEVLKPLEKNLTLSKAYCFENKSFIMSKEEKLARATTIGSATIFGNCLFIITWSKRLPNLHFS